MLVNSQWSRIWIENYEILPDHTNLEFSYNNKKYQVTTNLTSKFNIYNYLTCLSILNSIGFNTLFSMYITNTIKIEYKKKWF